MRPARTTMQRRTLRASTERQRRTVRGPIGLGDIQYPHDPEEVLGVSRHILWTSLVSTRQLSGRQGLDQREIQIKLPNGQMQSWELIWNTPIRSHCKIGQGWYQYCRAEELEEGDELMFWLLDGEDFLD
ncbi:DNA-binding barrel domain superfamily [Sesbania bispinosa]|nr:DNA-binding barrel domain superfamily [Sesbania bispinosa]